jgi:hypothetical protein
MRTQVEQIAALRSFGYTELESRFLYLVATHSGHFTRRQFLAFTAKSKGWAAHQFTTRLLRLAHARAVEYGRQTYVYNLYSRRIYDAIHKTIPVTAADCRSSRFTFGFSSWTSYWRTPTSVTWKLKPKKSLTSAIVWVFRLRSFPEESTGAGTPAPT